MSVQFPNIDMGEVSVLAVRPELRDYNQFGMLVVPTRLSLEGTRALLNQMEDLILDRLGLEDAEEDAIDTLEARNFVSGFSSVEYLGKILSVINLGYGQTSVISWAPKAQRHILTRVSRTLAEGLPNPQENRASFYFLRARQPEQEL